MFALRPTSALLILGLLIAPQFAAPQSISSDRVSLPRYVSFTGELKNQEGKPPSGTVDVTFLIYEEESGGEPLWKENQRVTVDAEGHFTVTLGANTTGGLPPEFFATKQARWLAMEPEGLPMPNRVLLLSVPYAYKAGDAETLGGLPPSAFLRSTAATTGSGTAVANPQAPVSNAPGGAGTPNYVPLWTPDGNTLGNSALYQAGSKIGIGTVNPASALQVYSGDLTIGPAALKFPTTPGGAASINQLSGSFLSRMALADGSGRLNLYWNSYNDSASNTNRYYSSGEPATKWNVGGVGGSGGTGLYVSPAGTAGATVNWKTVFSSDVNANVSLANNAMNIQAAGNVGIGTATPAAKLEVNGTGKFDGLVTFASGQTFPGSGTITGVTAGTGLTGGGTSGTVPLKLDNTYTDGRYAQLVGQNVFTGLEIINSGGGLGIGVVPSFPLHVNGVIRAETGLSLGGLAVLSVDADGIPGGHLLVDGSGNVGINNPYPASALDVVGNVTASGALIGSSLQVSGGVSFPNVSVGGDTAMTSAPHMYMSGYIPAPINAGVVLKPIFAIPSRHITITRFTIGGWNPCFSNGDQKFTLSTGPTSAALSNLFTLTVTTDPVGQTSDSGPLSFGISAGTKVWVFSNPIPACGLFMGPVGDLAINVEYVMQ